MGFVLYSQFPVEDAVTKFRELASEAGVLFHLYGAGPEIQSYDNPLVLWVTLVYSILRGSVWLNQMNAVTETLAHQFNPFTASVEVLKRLTTPPKLSLNEPVPAVAPTELPTPAPTPTGPQNGEVGPQPADPYSDLRQFSRAELKGKERAVIDAVCDAGGELPIADLAVKDGVDWVDPNQGFKDVQRRLNPKLKPQGWRLARQNNSGLLVNL